MIGKFLVLFIGLVLLARGLQPRVGVEENPSNFIKRTTTPKIKSCSLLPIPYSLTRRSDSEIKPDSYIKQKQKYVDVTDVSV